MNIRESVYLLMLSESSYQMIYWIVWLISSSVEVCQNIYVAIMDWNLRPELFVDGSCILVWKHCILNREAYGKYGYIESFNGKLCDEVLNCEVFDTLFKAKVLVERWRREYNHTRQHSSLGYHPPAPEVIVPIDAAWAVVVRFRSAPPNNNGWVTNTRSGTKSGGRS